MSDIIADFPLTIALPVILIFFVVLVHLANCARRAVDGAKASDAKLKWIQTELKELESKP